LPVYQDIYLSNDFNSTSSHFQASTLVEIRSNIPNCTLLGTCIRLIQTRATYSFSTNNTCVFTMSSLSLVHIARCLVERDRAGCMLRLCLHLGRAEGVDLKEVIDTKYCYGNSDEQTNVRLRNTNLVGGCVKGTAERYKLPAGTSEVKFCCS
jgi:hypothetical protein